MTPAARVQAAIEVLDKVLVGAAAEQALTSWARGARYAGSKDRAAVRDHVFQALRCKLSYAAMGGAETGRGLMLGQIHAEGGDPAQIFSGQGHAPSMLSAAELAAGQAPKGAAAHDLQPWLWSRFEAALGTDKATRAAAELKRRAPVTLRVNLRKTSVAQAVAQLSQDGIETRLLDKVETALQVTEGARRVAQSQAYADGLVELQDASSQAAMSALQVPDGAKVLDYCAGGGGKTLALAAQHQASWFAHDAAPERMRDLPARAARAGVSVMRLSTAELQQHAPFDLVLCDAPCSGSGTWRRAPEAKWRLTPERLDAYTITQAQILKDAAQLVRPGGVLAYATCSVLREENEDQVADFASKNPDWIVDASTRRPISVDADGFFLSTFAAPA